MNKKSKTDKPRRWKNGSEFERELRAFESAFPNPRDRTATNYVAWPDRRFDRHFHAYGGFYAALNNFGINHERPHSSVDTKQALTYFDAIYNEKQIEIKGQINPEPRPSISDYKRLRSGVDQKVGYRGPSYHYYVRRFLGWANFTRRFQQCRNGQITLDALMESVRAAYPRDDVPAGLRYEVMVLSGGICQFCEEKRATVIDHFVPRAMGGKSVRGNVRALCTECNLAKSDKPLEILLSCLAMIPINEGILDISAELRRENRTKLI